LTQKQNNFLKFLFLILSDYRLVAGYVKVGKIYNKGQNLFLRC